MYVRRSLNDKCLCLTINVSDHYRQRQQNKFGKLSLEKLKLINKAYFGAQCDQNNSLPIKKIKIWISRQTLPCIVHDHAPKYSSFDWKVAPVR